MPKFKCKECNKEINLQKCTMIISNGEVVTKGTECPKCRKFMSDVTDKEEGMPTIIRNEQGFRKTNRN
mgnify:CR=1 FL=1